MWLINVLGVIPIIVALFAVAGMWACTSDAPQLYRQGRYPCLLVSVATGLLLGVCAVLLVGLGTLLIVYDPTPLIVRYAP